MKDPAWRARIARFLMADQRDMRPLDQVVVLREIAMNADIGDVGPTPLGRRRIVPVTGGTFERRRLCGRVQPGGGDELVERADGVRKLDVRITLATDDSALI